MFQDAHPKGEIFIGHNSEGFALKMGVPTGAKDQGFSFTLETPDRSFLLSAQSEEDRSQWMNVIQKVIDKPLTPQDATGTLMFRNSSRLCLFRDSFGKISSFCEFLSGP